MKLVLVNKFITSWKSNGNYKTSMEAVNISSSLVNSYDQEKMAKRLLSKLLGECGDSSILKCEFDCDPRRNTLKQQVRSSADSTNNILKELMELFGEEIKLNALYSYETKKGNLVLYLCKDMKIKWNGNEHICETTCNRGTISMLSWFRISTILMKATRIHLKITAEVASENVFDTLLLLEEKHVVKKNKRILEDGIGSDVIITTGSGTEVPCHKCFLFESSPVFQTMFRSGLEESQTGRIDMSDVSQDGVKAFLSYLYYKDVKEFDENCGIACELLYAAHKYQVPALEEEMIKHLLRRSEGDFSVETAFRMYSFVRNIDAASDLKMKAVRIMKSKLEELQKLEEYEELFKKSPTDAMELCGLLAKTSLG